MSFPSHYRFEHEAMATTFALLIIHKDEPYARQVSVEVFRELDRLEGELSRFIESSSITRLNRAEPGEDIPVSADAYLCLKQALRIAEATEGAFDVGFRSRQRNQGESYSPPVALSECSVSARVSWANPNLDLGGIGKGYAVDFMATMLQEWDIERALILGGRSTLLALGDPPAANGWPVHLWGEEKRGVLLPSGSAISASGFSVQEEHVRDPGSGNKAQAHLRAWSLAPAASVADSLSTAFLVMDPIQIKELMKRDKQCGAILESASGKVEWIGMRVPLT